MTSFFIVLLFLSGSGNLYAKGTDKMQNEIKNAVETVFSTGMEDYEARKPAMAVLEAANWRCTPDAFKEYYLAGLTLTEDEVKSWSEREGVFLYYEAAWDKILRELETVQADADTVILWHVYNMGYIVKTAESCFAIDLHHRRSEELIGKLDFLLVTHNHKDHYTEKLLDGFRQAGKPLVTNFYPAPGYNAIDTALEFGPVKIHLHRTDHNPTLKNFVMTYEIEINLKSGKFVIFHSGDSHRPDQFRMKNPAVDVYIVHPRVGLKVPEAQKIIHPKLTLISHLHELHHPHDKWRWPYSVGLAEIEAGKTNGFHCAMPLWGEMIRFTVR